ncbi:nuclear transport factor 2 family protein [Streptomyces sp. NPDC020996]|uniref:nuclear transport factor 2 family protein n=1 Tax=Streptomyces sp. NPDC020996 TaxID=3154791 RepID=UPI0033EE21E4
MSTKTIAAGDNKCKSGSIVDTDLHGVLMMSLPPQAWAHRQGRLAMRGLQRADFGPEALAARAGIADAFYRFGIAYDEAQIDVIAGCFTEDAVFEVAEGRAEPFTRFEGRVEIHDRLDRIIAEQGDQRRHLISNILVDELDLATGVAAAIAYGVVTVAADGLRLGASVVYDARLRREQDGCWRFSAFFIGMDAYEGVKPASAAE